MTSLDSNQLLLILGYLLTNSVSGYIAGKSNQLDLVIELKYPTWARWLEIIRSTLSIICNWLFLILLFMKIAWWAPFVYIIFSVAYLNILFKLGFQWRDFVVLGFKLLPIATFFEIYLVIALWRALI